MNEDTPRWARAAGTALGLLTIAIVVVALFVVLAWLLVTLWNMAR